MADAMGETNKALRAAFDCRPTLEFQGGRITSDAGLLAYRGLDDSFDLTAMGASAPSEGRHERNFRHRLLGLLRQVVYGRLAGYEEVKVTERLAHGRAIRGQMRPHLEDADGPSSIRSKRTASSVDSHMLVKGS